MKKNIPPLALSALVLLVGGTAQAADGMALATTHKCLACHTVDKKMVGPSFKEVAASPKYKGKGGAEAAVAKSIMEGSSGGWGSTPMPANRGVSEADAKALAKWILSL